MPLSPGTRLGSYEVIGLLGTGGMGEVYTARDSRLGRSVAVKVVREGLATEADRVQRLEREARTLASINHPHIAALYGLEECDGRCFLVMELVPGETLADRLRRGPLTVEQALEVARQIADALEAAHERGIVHRDLKPANVKITPDDKVKVLDFGLAKAVEVERAPTSQDDSPTLSIMATQAGIILGTAAYMSPEQAKGLPADHRSDVFSFGVVLFEMLSGRQPFQGETAPDVLASVLVRDPDLSKLPPDLNPRIVELVRRCLEKSARRRWQAIGDVRAEIEAIAAAPRAVLTGAPAVTPPFWRRAFPLAGTAVIAAGLAGVVAWNIKPVPTAPVVRFSFVLSDLLSTPSRYSIAVSPDGQRIAYAAGRRLYLRELSEPETKPVPGTDAFDSVNSPVFSPDGRSLVFWAFRDRSIKRIPASGGGAITLCQASSPWGMSWGPNGIVFGQGTGGIMRVSPDGGKPEQLVSVERGELAHGPRILPGGEHVLFTIAPGSGQWDNARVVVQSLKTGERKTLVERGSDARYLPTGHLVYAVGASLHAVSFDISRLAVRGGAVPILDGVRRAASSQSATAHFGVSENGSLVYLPGIGTDDATRRQLVLMDRKGALETLKLPAGVYQYPRVSPDGRQIAFGTVVGQEAVISIYDLSGSSGPRRLTFGGNNRFPVWSADSKRVAFQSDREGDLAIWWQPSTSSGGATRLTTPDRDTTHIPESFSPKDDTLLFTSARGSDFALWALSIRDRKAAIFGNVRSAVPSGAAFSPDGRWVAYSSGAADAASLYVQPFPATGEIHAFVGTESDVPHQPVWTHEGTEIVYNPRPGNLDAVPVTTQPIFSYGTPTVLSFLYAAGPTLERRPFDITRTGQILRLASPDEIKPGADAGQRVQVVLNWFEDLRQHLPVP